MLLTNFLCIIAAFCGLWVFSFSFFVLQLKFRVKIKIQCCFYGLWLMNWFGFRIWDSHLLLIMHFICCRWNSVLFIYCGLIMHYSFFFFLLRLKSWIQCPFKGYILVWFYNLRFQCTIDYAYYYLTNIFLTFCFAN